MKIGEVCLMTSNVIRLANFYRQLLRIEGDCSDAGRTDRRPADAPPLGR